MKTARTLIFTALLLCFVIGMASALTFGMPGIQEANSNTSTGISISVMPGNPMNGWTKQTYSINVANDATINGFSLVSISGVYVYPNGGDAFSGKVKDIAAMYDNWFATGYSSYKNGFGYKGCFKFIKPGTENQPIGSASFDTMPCNEVFMIYGYFKKNNVDSRWNSLGQRNCGDWDWDKGYGYDCDNYECAYVIVPGPASPVPEPATMVLLLPGLLPLAGILRKKRN